MSSENSQILYILWLGYLISAWKLIGNTLLQVLNFWLKSKHVIKMSAEFDFTKPVLTSFLYMSDLKNQGFTVDKQEL